MEKLQFHKLQASGNDFILLDERRTTNHARPSYRKYAKKYCVRKFGIGADGLLVIEPSTRADFRMRIFNPDGSEAAMCGNGARCVALWAAADKSFSGRGPGMVRFDTQAGVIEAKVKNKKANYADAAINMVPAHGLKLEEPLSVCGRKVRVSFINTGVPHAVVFVQGVDKVDVAGIGRAIRYHRRFSPAGANVNFVEILKENFIKVRTYERGVEAETFACGTGITAGAIISGYKLGRGAGKHKVNVSTRGGEVLNVYFSRGENKITDIWLEGKVYFVYKGEVYSV